MSQKSRFFNSKQPKSRINVDKRDLNNIMNDVAFAQSGFLEKEDENEVINQRSIVENVDLFSAQKYFELNLDKFGPYRLNYTRNGRHLLIGGSQGHVASFDWQTKKLHSEINVMEKINDVKWLHTETMYAVAQRQWTYIYDNQGIELHCLKILDRVTRLEFLPYHFLLSSINECGYLSYIDVSLGKKVAGFSTAHGRCDVMGQNPTNAIIHLGHHNGVVTLWSPNVKEPLVKMLCHKAAVKSLAVNQTGNYMITSSLDHLLNVWDLRTYKQLKSIKLNAGASSLAFSQKNLIAAGLRNEVVIFKDDFIKLNEEEIEAEEQYIEDMTPNDIYLKHRINNANIQNLQFCPFEDVLGVGHSYGISSLLVPGSAEANFDAMEANPYESKNQRKQWEVKALLEKIQPELISLDPFKLKQVDRKTLEEKMIERNKKLFLKPKKIDFEPRLKMKGKSKTGKKEARKKAVKAANLKEFVKEVKEYERIENEENKNKEKKEENTVYNVFDRFKKKSK
ncbi:WD repeat-containing 46 [Brachionus plicatilis]|uniref:WD repeat-containing 46 n=1 Tax=Brachionus plicatilis TaxID=10195 RepID=A0A3M7P683_BRAPC|nr:WD repeat-containing 46 [Brachionus plicatilis]